VIRWAVGVLVVLWLLLPVRLPQSAANPSTGECLTVSDTPRESKHADLVRLVDGCLAVYPADPDVWAAAAQLRESSGRTVDAEAAYKRALQLDPANGDLRMRFARLLLKRGDAAGAHEQALAALRVQPNRQSVLDFLDETSPKDPSPGKGRASSGPPARVHITADATASGQGH